MENQQPVSSTTVRPGSLEDHLAKLTTIMNTSPAHGVSVRKRDTKDSSACISSWQGIL